MRRICAVTWRFTVTGESALLIVRSSLAGMQICYTRPPALVFQCRQCKSVLSDSLLFSCSIEALNVVVVTGVSSITVGANSQPCCLLQKSDTDSSFVPLACNCCGSAVGRLYIDAPAELAVLQRKFALDVTRINSYTLGESETRCAAPSNDTQIVLAAEATAHDFSSIPSLPPAGDDALLQRVAQLESDMIKVQNMLLLHSECLEQIGKSPVRPAMQNMATPSNHH